MPEAASTLAAAMVDFAFSWRDGACRGPSSDEAFPIAAILAFLVAELALNDLASVQSADWQLSCRNRRARSCQWHASMTLCGGKRQLQPTQRPRP